MATSRTQLPVVGRGPTDPLRVAANVRDVAIARSRSITKTIGVASVAAAAVLTMYVARAFPGHSATTSGSNPAASGGQSAGSPAPSSSGDGYSSNISPPSAAPAPSSQQAPVVSGST